MMTLLLVLSAHAGVWEAVEARRASPEAFVLPSVRERYALAMLARDLVRHARSKRLPRSIPRRAEALGWTISVEGDVAVLAEGGPGQGGGLLAVRLGRSTSALVVQAPHPWFDLNTGRIACRMFEENPEIFAVMVATVHRRAAPGSDAAHSPEQGFQAMTQGVVDGLPAPLFVQLHGYGRTSDADAVLSPGSAWMRPGEFESALVAVQEALDLEDVRTGVEVPELGAKTNVQGRLVAGRARFLHMELSKAPRDRLLAEPELRARLAAALRAMADAR
ncbi:MAG: hypothetical protein ACI8PZ_002984 [Myxococcota bacterium]|jgi:hypothetical protein